MSSKKYKLFINWLKTNGVLTPNLYLKKLENNEWDAL